MELEEMRDTWMQQQELIKENISLTKELLQTIKQREAGKAIRSMAAWEYLNLVVCLAILAWSTRWMPQFGLALKTCYFIVMLYMLYASITGIFRIRRLARVKVLTVSTSEALLLLERLHSFIRRYLVVDVIIFPVCIVALYALITYLIFKIDVFSHLERSWFRMLLAMIAGVMAAIGVYKNIYAKNIGIARRNLKEMLDWMNKEE